MSNTAPTPLEIVGEGDAPTCADGVCDLPEPVGTEPTIEDVDASV